MALRKIRVEGDEILVKKSKPIKEMTPRILELIEDMKDTMRNENGAGIAAVQVGVLKQVFLVDVNAGNPELGEEIKVFINPEILEMSGKVQDLEGCLSVPGQTGIITRAQKIKMKYLDENMAEQELVAEDFYAKALQHEYDHLQGILYNTKADATNLTDEEIEHFLKSKR
ncbi:MAG: peptide deformylase [Bacillota bacterium]|nr:peptide deformylase [Bacillota bacterium]